MSVWSQKYGCNCYIRVLRITAVFGVLPNPAVVFSFAATSIWKNNLDSNSLLSDQFFLGRNISRVLISLIYFGIKMKVFQTSPWISISYLRIGTNLGSNVRKRWKIQSTFKCSAKVILSLWQYQLFFDENCFDIDLVWNFGCYIVGSIALFIKINFLFQI